MQSWNRDLGMQSWSRDLGMQAWNRDLGMLLSQLRSCAREADGCCVSNRKLHPPLLANDLKLHLLRDEEFILWQPKGLSGTNPIDKNANQALNPSGVGFVPWPFPCSLPRV